MIKFLKSYHFILYPRLCKKSILGYKAVKWYKSETKQDYTKVNENDSTLPDILISSDVQGSNERSPLEVEAIGNVDLLKAESQ